MSEITEVLSAIESLHRQGRRMALATIVAVRGSTYHRPGARLLVPDTGEIVGNISGGCLEGDVEEVARLVMVEGEPRLVSFDLTADDEAVWGWGLGCNGAIEVFVEPAERAAEIAGALRRALEEERPLAVVTVLESQAAGVARGARLLVHPDGRREGSLGEADADESAAAAALAALGEGESAVPALRISGGEVRAFVEVLEPPLRLLVCGAGHDAIPVVRFAPALGWRVEVVDDRPAFLTMQRFPEAAGLIEAGPGEVAAHVDGRTHVIVMSHNFARDTQYLRALLPTAAPHVGIPGPRPRLEHTLADLEQEGAVLAEADLARLHGPAGLDLGAEGPEEIAWSIVAEVLAVRRRRPAGFLRDRRGPIHRRPEPAGTR